MTAPATEAPAHVNPPPALRTVDRCDAPECNAQALVVARFDKGDLWFCGHHWNRYEPDAAESVQMVFDSRLNDE